MVELLPSICEALVQTTAPVEQKEHNLLFPTFVFLPQHLHLFPSVIMKKTHFYPSEFT
jgi:hypothetical protein